MQYSEQVDKGEIKGKEFEKILSEHTGLATEKIWPGVKEKIVIDDTMITFMKTLKRNYRIVLLSNFIYEWLHEILVTNNLYEIFDETIISSQHGIIKPGKEIFQLALDRLHLKKNEVVFIDDRQANIDGAQRFGIKSFLYTTIDSLKQEFRENGIRID